MSEPFTINFTVGGKNFSVESKKCITPTEEIKVLLAVNKQMIQFNGLFYMLDFYCFSTGGFNKAIHDGNIEQFYSDTIYPHITSPKYRSEQLLLYKQLPIFEPVIPLIEGALKAFFSLNYIVAYFALVPVVEGLLRKWNGNIEVEIDPRAFIKKKFSDLQCTTTNKEEHPKAWECHNIDLLRHSIKSFFSRPDNGENTNTFNRNIVSHFLADPKSFDSWENSLKLLSIIDLIAKCYTYENPLERGGVIKPTRISSANGQDEVERWSRIFCSCAPKIFTLPVIRKNSKGELM